MAIAHVCMQCGFDLARTHPAREPHYNLLIITCPRCQRTCVRQVHPTWRRWREIHKAAAAVAAMAVHVIVLALLVGFNLAAVFTVSRNVYGDFATLLDKENIAASMYLVAGALITGAWLRAGFAHLPRWRVWFAWFSLLAMLSSIDVAMHQLGLWLREPDLLSDDLVLHFHWRMRMLAIGAIMIISLTGIPLGRIIAQSFQRHSRRRWRKYRVRRRRLSAAA